MPPLRDGDQTAFAHVPDRHSAALLHVSAFHVGSRHVAEEVVQDTWMAVIQGTSTRSATPSPGPAGPSVTPRGRTHSQAAVVSALHDEFRRATRGADQP